MARALRYNGILPNFFEPDGSIGEATPERYAEIAAYVAAHRTALGPFEIIVEGVTRADDPPRRRRKYAPSPRPGGRGGSSRRGRHRTGQRTSDAEFSSGTTTLGSRSTRSAKGSSRGQCLVAPWDGCSGISFASFGTYGHVFPLESRPGQGGVVDGRTCGGDRRRLDEVTARPGHDLGLFSYDASRTAFRAAALEVTHDPVGLLGRGLYIGVRPGLSTTVREVAREDAVRSKHRTIASSYLREIVRVLHDRMVERTCVG